jgi:diguanylate cyclase (GGDEF)-like protein
MDAKNIKVLLIEDSRTQAILIRAVLAKAGAGGQGQTRFDMAWAERLSVGLELLRDDAFEVILLDLSLPDADGLETLLRVRDAQPNAPIVVLTGRNDEELAVQAMQAGAQDYLIKENFDGQLLVRALRYAIERNRMQAALRSLSLTDELTGLYNRRGFYALAEQQFLIARTRGGERRLLLFYIDMDGLKQINDTFGHAVGSRALTRIAEIIKKTFRESDIAGRVGGDEFTVLALEATSECAALLLSRLRENLRVCNAEGHEPYELSFSVGLAQPDADSTATVEELIVKADAAMYEEKRKRRKCSVILCNPEINSIAPRPNEAASTERTSKEENWV